MKKIISILLVTGSFFTGTQTLLPQNQIADSIAKTELVKVDSVVSSTDNTIKSIGAKFDAPDVSNLISFSKIFWALVFIAIGYFMVRFLTRSIEIWSEKSPDRRVKGKAIVPVVKIICWMVIAYIIVKGIFNPPLGSLIAFGASVGVAVGFAAQDILKNIFGGFVIIIDRPFKIGDKIEVGSTYGEVLDMSLRSTRVQTADDSIVTLPNGELMNQSISNSNSGETNCQVVAEIYLPITIDTHQVRKIAMEVAKVSNYVYLAKPIAVVFVNDIKYDKLCYKMRLKAYVMDIRFEFAFKSELTENVIKELLNCEILSSANSI
ncbi:mechanosensitive ion channel protein MscS [Labilibaculum manganireducens]|uniref:Mechanosensitive ion channel protein MscS n=1 Tax=Labilibaculum manganireducens TaxID=1940525 RepID=A0A2N3HTH9_9BACT|nr:mechanosensitive ion channel domain-containing protein [Labilibaculum manganireducens]PKQ61374.1 mechanosensitive ion channel protein MscS [Labilibaculum manganireducens]